MKIFYIDISNIYVNQIKSNKHDDKKIWCGILEKSNVLFPDTCFQSFFVYLIAKSFIDLRRVDDSTETKINRVCIFIATQIIICIAYFFVIRGLMK